MKPSVDYWEAFFAAHRGIMYGELSWCGLQLVGERGASTGKGEMEKFRKNGWVVVLLLFLSWLSGFRTREACDSLRWLYGWVGARVAWLEVLGVEVWIYTSPLWLREGGVADHPDLHPATKRCRWDQ